MSTAAIAHTPSALPAGAAPVRPHGLLAGVVRPCPQHEGDCGCVARTSEGRLVFWCAAGAHHFSAR